MKILVTGKRSYIASNICAWLKKNHPYFQVDQKSVGNEFIPSLNQYNVIIHCAGLVNKNEFLTSSQTFMKVNRDLTLELAKKAKQSNVNHFIYISSIDVYGAEPDINNQTVISKDTEPNPSTSYGKSKLEAETALLALETEHFKVAIVRPPTVYGKNASGDYGKLLKFSKTTHMFPLLKNERSMLNILNLCQLINLIVTFKSTGIFHPQDRELANVSNLIKNSTSEAIYLSEFLASVLLIFNVSIIKRLFGNIVYDKQLSNHFDEKYIVYPPKTKNKSKNNSTILLDL